MRPYMACTWMEECEVGQNRRARLLCPVAYAGPDAVCACVAAADDNHAFVLQRSSTQPRVSTIGLYSPVTHVQQH